MAEFNFDLKGAAIFQAIRWERYPLFRSARILKRSFFWIFVFLFFLFLISFFSGKAPEDLSIKIFGLIIISLSLTIFFWLTESFFNLKLKNPKQKIKISEVIETEYNLAEFLSFEVAKAVFKAIRFARLRKISQIDSSFLFYFLLKDNPKLNFIFSRANLSLPLIQKELKLYLESFKGQIFRENFSFDFQETILEALTIAQKKNHQKIEIGDILTALSFHNPIFKRILIDSKLKVQDIENLTWWLESLEEKIERSKKFWSSENLIKKGSIAKDWAAGYTITLDQYSLDWTEIIKKRGFEEIIGHQEALAHLERVLAREEMNNALLVGEPGSGRRSIIRALAQKVLLGESLPQINYKRVVQLDIVSILAQSQSEEELTRILETIFNEVVSAGNVILVIDEFYNFVTQPKGALGVVDISGILLRYLPLVDFRLIGITSYYGFHLFVEKNPAILEYLEKVEVKEISEKETILILENFALFLEKKSKKFILYPTIRDTVNFSARYITDLPFPKKAMDLLEEVLVYTQKATKSPVVLPEYVTKVLSEKTDIPLGEIEIGEREILLNLEKLLHQRIINQEEGVREISQALRRARAEVTIRKGPMGTFLFLGPTGVGKTETSKALAEIYFGKEEKMIRLDMSEFQAIEDIPKLIGSPDQEGLLTTPVRENPFSLILLDEIEKAHPNILNLFLQVFDEGFLTDGLGRKVIFTNTIIIATSNAGYQVILEALKQKVEWSEIKEKLLDFLFQEGIFRPEFINRFDGVVVFKPLTQENLLDIAELLLSKLKKNLAQKDIEFIITQPLKEKIAELGYNPVFGAREMRRVIQDKVENVFAKALLEGELKRGDRVEVDPEGFKLVKK